jgi:DNA-binding GntR family transcriptional regulator
MTGLAGTTTVVDAVASALRDRLLDGSLPPGHVLRDTVLTEEFGVARPTVRAAVQLLVAEGLVERDRGRSARVPLISPADVADLYTARAAVEMAAVDLIERRAPTLDPLKAAFGRLQAIDAGAQWRAVVDADVDFHETLVAMAGSPRLLALFATLANETRLIIALQRTMYESVDQLVDEHRRILGALQRKRYDSCRRLLREHFDHSVTVLSRDLDGSAHVRKEMS